MNKEEVIKQLRNPFTSKEIEWKIQVTVPDKNCGMVVAYVDSRAIQKRLDEVVGAFNWRNEYIRWHEKSQICGISIYNDERNEWITKFDGAENSSVEPIKGGLSDSFKRAAVLWGIGRYLYEINAVWVDIEQKGKSYVIKDSQFSRLENEYNDAIAKIFSFPPLNQSNGNFDNKQSQSPPVQKSNPVKTSAPAEGNSAPQKSNPVKTDTAAAVEEYEVCSVKPSGEASQLIEIVNGNGEKTKAYVKKDNAIMTGVRLRNVDISIRDGRYGQYNAITKYELVA